MTSRRLLAGVVIVLGVVATVAAAQVGDGRGARDRTAASSSSTTTSTTEPETVARSSVPAAEVTTSSLADQRVAVDFVGEPIDGRRLIVLSDGSLQSVDLDGNAVVRVEHDVPIDMTGARPAGLLATGRRIFFVSAGKVYVADQTLEGGVRELGDAELAIASERAGHVWVARERAGGYVLDEIDGSGAVARTSQPLPVDTTPRAPIGNAIVLETPSRLEVWDPTSGRVRWSSPDDVGFVAVAGRSLVWRRYCDSSLCVLHVVDPATGVERTVPAGNLTFDGWPGAASASLDGRYLATSSVDYGERERPFRVSVVDLDTGVILEAEATDGGTPVWSPDGKWIFLTFGGDPERPIRDAFRFDRGTLRPVALRIPPDTAGVAVAVV